jgi:hypothetical protein
VRSLPRWLAWFGFVCGGVLLFAAIFLPVIALPIWLIAASVVLRRPTFKGSLNRAEPREGSSSARVLLLGAP